jgi:hypothetical protein
MICCWCIIRITVLRKNHSKSVKVIQSIFDDLGLVNKAKVKCLPYFAIKIIQPHFCSAPHSDNWKYSSVVGKLLGETHQTGYGFCCTSISSFASKPNMQHCNVVKHIGR